MREFYDTEGFEETMDVSASTRKFQTSIIVIQDPNKSGIVSFLSPPPESSNQSQNTTTSENNNAGTQGNY